MSPGSILQKVVRLAVAKVEAVSTTDRVDSGAYQHNDGAQRSHLNGFSSCNEFNLKIFEESLILYIYILRWLADFEDVIP